MALRSRLLNLRQGGLPGTFLKTEKWETNRILGRPHLLCPDICVMDVTVESGFALSLGSGGEMVIGAAEHGGNSRSE